MLGLKVFAPYLKAMGHHCIEANFVAVATCLNTKQQVLRRHVRGHRSVGHSYVLHCIQGKTTLAVVLGPSTFDSVD